jgi:hypothetical protein
MLRQRYAQYWLRFYSLPEGKRHATDAAEKAELLRRQNSVLSAALGVGQECAVIHVAYDVASPELAPLDLRQDDGWSASINELLASADYPSATACHVAVVTWQSGAYDRVLEAIAADETGPLLFVALSSSNIGAPYDGGVDCFVRDPPLRDTLRARFAPWRSDHPLGL